MEKHFNVQVHVQEVQPKQEARNPHGSLEKGPMGAVLILEKRVKEVLSLAVTADSEEEAYAKAIRMLRTASPEPVQHQHSASCHGAIGELQCGER